MILISACLVGVNCKYNGENNYNEKAMELLKSGEAILVCPEQLGGLTTPREPSEIKEINGKKHVINNRGNDVTIQFEKGANEVLKLVKELDIKKAVLQSRSPSCGVGMIYDGNFQGKLVNGNGILAQLLLDNGIEVVDISKFMNM